VREVGVTPELANHVIVCSESMKRKLRGLFELDDNDNISVVPNGVDIARFN